MAFNPTSQQKQAIETPTPLLVCAAAGSGKTAVLAQRVASMLSDPINPVSADRLLIVTFTNAAAAEMRERIERNISELCDANPGNRALIRQKLLLESAKICTIDSFCIDFVRENSVLAGIDPDFRMLDSFELSQLLDRSMTKVLNRWYLKEDSDFSDLLDALGSDNGDGNLINAIKKIYDYTRNIPFHNEWLDQCALKYDFDHELGGEFYSDLAFSLAEKQLSEIVLRFNEAVESCKRYEHIYIKYLANFNEISVCLEKINQALNSRDWDSVIVALSEYNVKRLPSNKEPDEQFFADAIKWLKADIKSVVDSISKIFYADSKTVGSHMKFSGRLVRLLICIEKEFEIEVEQAMRAANAYTFYNTERMALELLCEKIDGELRYLPAAEQFSSNYDEVLVDEYQDVNDLQDMLFNILSGFGKRLFAVGDAKQSIYGFRGSNPQNFTNKIGSSFFNCVDMSGNFRSRPEICGGINYVFNKISSDYSENEWLIPMKDFPQKDIPRCELHLTEGAKSSLEGEAERIAIWILNAIKAEPFLMDKNGGLRQAEFSDFAVLMPTVRKKADIFLKVFQEYGIPACVSSGGFAKATEILTIVSLLKVIDNPTRDANLLSVMLSPIGSFSADEVASIRAASIQGSIYQSVLFAKENGNEKCESFCAMLSRLRSCALTMPISEFISHALVVTGYRELVCALGNSRQRQANLGVLFDLARSYEAGSGSNLRGFILYLDRVLDEDFESPVITADNNSVRLMSLHKSKGLQFPVCIMAGMAERFRNLFSESAVAISEEFGVSISYTDEVQREKNTSLARLVMSMESGYKNAEEKKRLLYVGMTRAEEMLVMVSNRDYKAESIKKAGAALMLCKDARAQNRFLQTRLCSTFSDYLIPALLLNSDAAVLREIADCNFLSTDNEKTGYFKIVTDIEMPENNSNSNETIVSAEPYEAICEELKAAISFKYPYDLLNKIEAKTSVSALTHSKNSDYNFASRPAFLSAFSMTPAERGTAMHRFMEIADYNAAASNIEDEILRLVEYEFISKTAADSLDRAKLKRFFESDLYLRFKNAQFARHELRFITQLDAANFAPEHAKELDGEKVMVQGAVDLVFAEDDGLVLVDFKTDRNKTAEELTELYADQLGFYAFACEKLLKLPVKEKIIYSFELNSSIKI